MKGFSSLAQKAGALLLLVVFICGCRESVSDVEDGGKSDGGDDGTTQPVQPPDDDEGEVNDGAGFYIKVFEGENIQHRTHILGDDSKACTVKQSDTDKDVECVIDVPEEDLYFHGLNVQYNVPSDMCSYVRFMPYYFQNWEIGYGPGAISYRKPSVDSPLYIDTTADTTYGRTVEGDPVCIFDYTDIDGPNCCLGNYVLTTVYPDENGVDVINTVKGSWGGNIGACLGGTATLTQAKTESGYPRADLYYVEGEGINKVYRMEAPINVYSNASNLHLANYAVTNPHFLFEDDASDNGYSDPYKSSYDVQCLDRAGELNARIRFYVREWNELAEFESAGDSDTGPAGAVEDAPFDDFLINDFSDLLDVQLDFDNFSTYPMLEYEKQ